jgi:hypothetical protein
LTFSLGGSIQIHGIGVNFSFFVRGNKELYGRLTLWTGFDFFHHQTADINGIKHGLGKTFVEIYLHTPLFIVNSRENQPFLCLGILLQNRIEFPVSYFYAYS